MDYINELVNEVEKNKKCKRDDIVNMFPRLNEVEAYERFTVILRELTGKRYYVAIKNDDYFFYDIIKGKGN